MSRDIAHKALIQARNANTRQFFGTTVKITIFPTMPNKVLIIGAGGVANVVAQKCAQNSDVFGELLIASRTESKAKTISGFTH